MNRRELHSYLQCLGLDALLLAGVSVLSYYARPLLPVPGHIVYPFRTYLPFYVVMLGAWLVFLHIYGMYGGIEVGNLQEFGKALFKINYNFLLTVAVVSFALRLTTTNRLMFFAFAALANLLLIISRRHKPFRLSNRYAILGRDQVAVRAYRSAERLFKSRDASFLGFFSPGDSAAGRTLTVDQTENALGSLDDMFEAITAEGMDTVIVALPSDFGQVQPLLDRLRKSDVRVLLAREVPSRIELYPLEG